MKMKTLARGAALLAVTLVAGAAGAADYPSQPVKIVVPYPPGGSTDIVARVLAQQLTEETGETFFVENLAGAGGNVGADAVARSDADGYTLLVAAPPPLTINNALYSNVPFTPEEDFAPVALLASVPIVLSVSKDLGVTDVAGLLAMAKDKPGDLAFGSSGNGSTNHLAGELLKKDAGIDMFHVPYKGAAPAMNDLIAGHIQVLFDNMPAVLPQAEGGRIVPIAVASPTRSAAMPDVPTLDEAGVPGFEASAWFGLVAPAAVPAEVLETLTAKVEDALSNPAVQSKLAELGATPSDLTGKAFGDYMATERVKWAEIIESSGAKID